MCRGWRSIQSRRNRGNGGKLARWVTWNVENGHDFDFLQGIAYKTGKEPDKLKALPELDERHFFYIDAFSLLSRSRSVGFGVGGIPLGELLAYTKLYEVNDVDRFVKIISEMDKAFTKAKPPKKK